MKGLVDGFPGISALRWPGEGATEQVGAENTGSFIGVVLTDDIANDVIGRLVLTSVGVGAGGLGSELVEVFLRGQGRRGGGGSILVCD